MIFLTGGAFTPRSRAFLDETPNQRVEKPFDARHLRALINDRVLLVNELENRRTQIPARGEPMKP